MDIQPRSHASGGEDVLVVLQPAGDHDAAHHRRKVRRIASACADRVPTVIAQRYHHLLQESLWFARFAQTQAEHRCWVLTEMAKHSSFGGGWASVKNPAMSAYHATKMYRLASMIGDENIQRKARVFLCYAFHWAGNSTLTEQLLDLWLTPQAREAGDVETLQRCSVLMQIADGSYYGRPRVRSAEQQADEEPAAAAVPAPGMDVGVAEMDETEAPRPVQQRLSRRSKRILIHLLTASARQREEFEHLIL